MRQRDRDVYSSRRLIVDLINQHSAPQGALLSTEPLVTINTVYPRVYVGDRAVTGVLKYSIHLEHLLVLK